MNPFFKYVLSMFMLMSFFTRAQDIHFSQYYLSPLSLNPAHTGNYRGDFRFFGNYRNQWRDINNAYNTFSAGGDFNVFPKNVNLSGGIIFLNDKSGGNLIVNKIIPSGAFHKNIKGYKLHFGLQAGLVIKSIDFYAHSFPNQLNWTKGGFDNTLPNNEVNVGQRFVYLDCNTGLHASKRYGKWEPELGYAVFHLNEPKESFLSNKKNFLRMRHAYNAALSYSVSPSVILKGYTLYGYTSEVSDWVSGLNVEYVLSRESFFDNSVFVGFMWRSGIKRNPDAGIVTAGVNYRNYTIGFSYDITFSQLKTSVDSKGAFEMAFIYRGKSTRLVKKYIPCERY